MERKKIIIDEIKHWKKTRLLPEQYCNFLLTLYTEGEETGNLVVPKENRSKRLFQLIMMTFGLVIFGLTFLVIYFTDFSPFLQTGLVFIFSSIMFLLAVSVKKDNKIFMHLYILLGALMVFLAMVYGVSSFFPDQPQAIFVTIIFTCFVWLLIGKRYNLKYFIFSGVFGVAIGTFFLFFNLK
ncbi:hypothetical protein H1D32_19455 [Anaerobacillus sp. CMMVII]|uniref:hypothetical protein n=1 Tax=Anaerobacillus sp. CMMVII TaxID=2755588 RepID=UPI0021B6F03D|nr:hypothetical protein [Anaerobacillus sp. CMMVII]MCT8139695.1 hypothetical protein [Anaerobacillus sp. CMMVII]